MGLTPKEIGALAPEGVRLGRKLVRVGEALVDMFKEDSDGGKKATKEEIGKLGRRVAKAGVAALTFAPKLLRDLVD